MSGSCAPSSPDLLDWKDRDNAELRALWKPILDKYKVDLVLQGHDHTYGRTGLSVPATLKKEESVAVGAAAKAGANVPQTIANVATGVQTLDETTGTVYVVSVSGPKMYNLQRSPFMKRVAEDTQLYQIIQIDGPKLHYEARTAVGELYDAFELHKVTGEINKLIEIEPEVPQRLRPEIPAAASK